MDHLMEAAADLSREAHNLIAAIDVPEHAAWLVAEVEKHVERVEAALEAARARAPEEG